MSPRVALPAILPLLALLSTTAAGAVTLVEHGRPVATILTADEPSEATALAVSELNYWIKRITGTELPVVRQGQWNGKGTVVAVGPGPFMKAKGISVAELGPEGARVVIADDYIALLGRDDPPVESLTWRGTYYAVLELVQKVFGVRCIWPGELGEVFQPRQTLTAPVSNWTWETPLTVRRSLRSSYPAAPGAELQEKLGTIGMTVDRQAWQRLAADTDQWLRRQRMNGAVSNISFGHSFTTWWDRYGKDHPEWFAMKPDGTRPTSGGKGTKLCVSNPELRQRIFEEWHEAWKNDPAANSALRACPNDSRSYCTCPACRAWDSPEMAALTADQIYASPDAILSDRYAKFWSDLAARATAVDPKAVVTGYAYRSYRKPPLHEKLHPAVMVGYVGGEGFYPQESHVRDEWQRWAAAGARLQWRPNLLHCGHSAPYVFARELGEDFKFFHAHKMVGTDFDTMMGAWGTQGPTYYVLAELHSRPEANVDDLLNEFYGAFGPAGDAVGEYFGYWERITAKGPAMIEEMLRPASLTWGQWFPGFIRLVPRLYAPEVLGGGEAILKRAEAAAAGDELAKARVAVLRVGLDHTRLMAAALREMELLEAKDPAGDEGRLKQARVELKAFRTAHAGSIAAPMYQLTARELTYKNTSPVWLRGE